MKLTRLVTGLVMAGLVATTGYAADMSAAQKKQVQDVVREYLIQNPEVIVQSLQVFQQKQMDQARKTMQKTQDDSPKFVKELFHQSSDPFAGNPNGKITVVEFFDYQCPHCIDMVGVIDDLIKNNSNVRVVFKEFPIRGPMSEYASRAALAAQQQGKYFELHKALMQAKQQPLTEASIMEIAKSVGLDTDKLKAALNSSAVNQQLKDNYNLAKQLQLMGTPALFVAASNVTESSPASAIVFVPGQVDASQMNAVLQKVSK